MRIAFRAVVTVVLVVLGLLLVGPQQLGGPVALVSTFGDSMSPTYTPHDLIVVARSSDYAIGDVVAYRSEDLRTVVLHRIVDTDGDRYVFQGDNNDWLDPERPRDDQLIGQARLRIPQAGRLLELPAPIRVAAIVGLAALLLAGGRLVRPRRSRAGAPAWRGRRSSPQRARRRRREERPRAAADRGASWVGWPGQLAATAAAVALVATALAALAFTHPTTAPAEVDYTHEGAFTYTGDAPAGPVYPDGQVTTGDTVFLRLVDTVEVTFTHRLAHDTSSDLQTTGQLNLELEDGSGWSRSLPLGDETEVDSDDELVLDADLDARSLQQTFAQVQRATGIGPGSQSVTVTAEVETTGVLAGEAFSDRFASTMSFQLDELRLLPGAATSEEQDGADDTTFGSTEEGTLDVADAEPARLELAWMGVDVSLARTLSAVGLALALLALAVATVGAWRRRGLDEAARLQARYGSRLVEVDTVQPPPGHGVIDVADMATLVAFADRTERAILHQTRGTSHTYLVEGHTVHYRYHLDVEQHGIPGESATQPVDQPRSPRRAATEPAPDRPATPPPPHNQSDPLFRELADELRWSDV